MIAVARRAIDGFFANRFHVIAMPALCTLLWDIGQSWGLPVAYYAMITLSVAAAYWHNIMTDREEDEVNDSHRGRLIDPYRSYTPVLIGACMAGSLVLAIRAGWQVVLLGTVLNLFGWRYGAKFRKPGGATFRIKAVPGLKNIYSCVFWSIGLLISPAIYLARPIGPELILPIYSMFMVTFFVELLWDIRDESGDAQAGVRTIPLVLGERFSFRLLHLVNLLAFAPLAWAVWSGHLPAPYWVMVAYGALVHAYLPWFARTRERQLASHVHLLLGTVAIVITLVLSRSLASFPGIIGNQS
jgi:4-hydroxybenzoate polyprenyltransferase